MSEEFNVKLDFLKHVIGDTQATIRALDVKLGFLFVIYFAPLISWQSGVGLFISLEVPFRAILVIATCSWGLGLYFLFLALSPISSPKIDGEISGVKGLCFNGHLFQSLPFFALKNHLAEPGQSIEEYTKNLPKSEGILKELVFDLFKLVAIRNIKMKRVESAIYCSFFFIFLFVSLIILKLFLS